MLMAFLAPMLICSPASSFPKQQLRLLPATATAPSWRRPWASPFPDAVGSGDTEATAAVAPTTAAGGELPVFNVQEIKEKCRRWLWKGSLSVNYFVSGNDSDSKPPALLVHGFGASVSHWRRNIGTLTKSYAVYAIDLLGFGASDKPMDFSYNREAWAEASDCWE